MKKNSHSGIPTLRWASWALPLLFTIGLSCSPPVEEKPAISISATIFPLADWCRRLAPPGAEVVHLIPPNQSPHTYEPGITEAKQISRAQLVVRMGYGFDDWIDRLIQSARGTDTIVLVLSEAQIFDTSAAVNAPVSEEPDTYAAEEHPEDEHAGEAHEHEHGVNPHFWLDPVWAQGAVRRISDRMQDIYPEQAAVIEERTQEYLRQLEELDRAITDAMAQTSQREYIGYHGAFEHFAARYGLVEKATIEPWAGKEPSMSHIKGIVQVLREMSNPLIFIEPQLSGKAAEVLATETGARVLYLDPIGNPDVPERSSYIQMMNFNLESLKKGFSQTP